MDLKTYLEDIKRIGNSTIEQNCWENQLTVLEGLQSIMSKTNEIIEGINTGIIKGEKGEQGIQGEKGDKGDTGIASETINDNLTDLNHTWSSSKIDSLFENINDSTGATYSTEENFFSINNSKNGVISNIKLEGKTIVDNSVIKSVGDGGDTIKIKSTGSNLIDIDNFKFNESKRVFLSKGNYVFSTIVKTQTPARCGVIIRDKDQVPIANKPSETGVTKLNFTLPVDGYVDISFGVWDTDCIFESATSNMLNYGTDYIQYNNYNESYKKVLYKGDDGTWKKPILRVGDSIENHSDGKYYYHEKSYETKLNGSESWNLDATLTNTIRCYFRSSDFIDAPMIADKIKCINDYNLDEEHIYTTNGQLWIFLNKTKLPTQDVSGVKAWLQANNISIVYQLSQENVYECTNLDLISYDTQTNYSIDCGSLYPKSSFNILSYFGNVLSNIIRRITNMEVN